MKTLPVSDTSTGHEPTHEYPDTNAGQEPEETYVH